MRNVISRVKGGQPTPILLVANKLDLEYQREVSTEEGTQDIKTKSLLCYQIFMPFILSSFNFFRSRTSRDVGLSIH